MNSSGCQTAVDDLLLGIGNILWDLQGPDVSKELWKSGASHCLCQENCFKSYCKAKVGDVIRGQSLSISLFVISDLY